MTSRTQTIIIALVVVGVCVLFFLGVMVGAAVIGYKAALRAGNEAAAIQDLKTIGAAEVQYFNTHNRTFGTLDQLVSEQLLSAKFSGHPNVADGFVFTLSLAPKADGSSYELTADPESDATETKHFYLGSGDNRIRVNSERQADPSDPVNQ